MRKIAISDIHGCLETFDALLKKINYTKADKLFLLGDFVDRGPHSKGVIDRILDYQQKGHEIVCLKGNHEEMMENALAEKRHFRHWHTYGGKQTMESFGVLNLSEIEEKYWNFFADLEVIVIDDPYIFVHAGLNFNNPYPLSDTESMLWIRNWYQHINWDWLKHRIIVHGHTPQPKEYIEKNFLLRNQLHYLDIDAGCFHVNNPKLGHLCAFDITHNQLHFQKNIDDMSSWKNQL